MPGYLANRWFNSVSEMSTFLVDSTDEDGLGPFVVRVDDTSFKLVVWRKSSAQTIDNDVIYPANGPGRWVALASTGSNINTDDMFQFIDIDAMKAYTETPSETMLYCLNLTPPAIYAWDSVSTATESGTDIVKITALNNGRMYKIYPAVSSASSIILSNDQPTTVLPSGTYYIWTENGAVNTYDSVISYVSNGTVWIELDTRIRTYAGTPDYVEFYDPIEDLWDSTTKTPNSSREQWIDTTTGAIYIAFSGGWVAGAGVS